MSERLSKDFWREEFACKGKNCCGNSAPVSDKLVRCLQAVRNIARGPLNITSGFRCRAHNKVVSKVKNSYHTLGMAADVQIDMEKDRFLAIVKKVVDIKGVGVYNGWYHLDVRDEPAYWESK